jgi:predicted nucleic acid-binding protein
LTNVQVPGYHNPGAENKHLEAFFEAAAILPISDDMMIQATRLHQIRNLSLGDALITATALVYNHRLATRFDGS